ncbi:FHA domain-containing protein [Curtobacterium sp. MCBA15_004]|uniref:FHA domain-containing protein n=1 Tax=unclassified Curtobacterium TaxID=257496 RepID=UPI0008DCA063|nr:FHA domain-containing protein [Curtobacterium sp. MCBA15_004]WIA95342.1 FHA domain-containing protein [Curtobacterium sp. MCBA15_004]
MPSALVGSLSCARCSRILASGERFCTRCGAPQVAAAGGAATSTAAGLLTGVVPANATRRRTAVLVDVLATVLPAVAVALAAPSAEPATRTAWGVATAVLVLVAQLVATARSGRTVGLAVCRARRVDVLTALPPAPLTAVRGALVPWSAPATITADLRRGRDPLTPARVPLDRQELGPAVVPVATGPAEGRRAARTRPPAGTATHAAGQPDTIGQGSAGSSRRGGRDTARLLDVRLVPGTGDAIVVRGTVLVGRRPESDAPDVTVLALPDIARTLSRNHAVLEWADELLWVTDLHTTNGTTITSPEGTVQPLVPGQRTAAALGWRVELGERTYTVTAGTRAVPAVPRPDHEETTARA